MTEHQLPTYEDLLWPTLKALENRGGSASIKELSEQVATDLALSDEILTSRTKVARALKSIIALRGHVRI